jgi:hypothetical protein
MMGRVVGALVGTLLIVAACALTFWATLGDAEKIAADITQRVIQALPATADLTRKALDALQ